MTARCLGICVLFPRQEPNVCGSARRNHDPAVIHWDVSAWASAVVFTAATTGRIAHLQCEPWGQDGVMLKRKSVFFLWAAVVFQWGYIGIECIQNTELFSTFLELSHRLFYDKQIHLNISDKNPIMKKMIFLHPTNWFYWLYLPRSWGNTTEVNMILCF